MGRGSSGGGGRSSGGSSSSSRSSGGRSSSGSRGSSISRSSFSSGSRGTRSTFSSSVRPPMGGIRPPIGGGYRPPPPPMRRTTYSRTYYGRNPISSVISSIVIIFILICVLNTIVFSSLSGASNVTKSTRNRTALPAGSVQTTSYWYEYREPGEGNWIGNTTALESGMKNFYKKTGVQPFLYLTGTVNGSANPSNSEVQAFANSLYDQLFTDEGHFLLVFQNYDDSSNYQMAYVTGKQAETVIDQEAADIIMDYIEYYYYTDVSEEQLFSKAFDDSAERIMTITKSPWIPVFILVGVIVLVVVLFQFWKARKAQKNREDEATERILNSDIDHLSGGDDLEDRYT